MKRLSLALGFQILFILWGMSQPTAIILGKIIGSEGVPLPHVNLSVVGTTSGTSSNDKGLFELVVPADDSLTLGISSVGYATQMIRMLLQPGEKKQLNISLQTTATRLSDVEIRDNRTRNANIVRIDPKIVTSIPTINASVEDMIKTLPGVSSRNELSSQYSVRGGNYDENLIYVNDIEIYRPFLIRSGQQEGLSFINPDLVSGIIFSSGGFDARFGDKMASVLDIRYKKPTSFAGSFDVSLLGASGHLEGTAIRKKLTYLVGARYKSNRYALKTLETKGDYKPSFFDFQGQLTYTVSKKFDLSLLGNYSRNSYRLAPESRETRFGTLGETYAFKIYFDGQEVDRFENYLVALTATYSPVKDLQLRFITSTFQTFESETYDIQGQYWIGKLEQVPGGNGSGEVSEILGVGTYLDHARNRLYATVYSAEHRGHYLTGKSFLQWGLKYQYEDFYDRMNEWEMVDSAGYTLPRPPDTLGVPSYQPALILKDVIKVKNQLFSNRMMGFLQNTWTFEQPGSSISLTAGARVNYWDISGQWLVSPRASISYKPLWKNETVFRLSAGVYSQPPFYREMKDLMGRLNTNIKAQKSYHVVAGSDYYFKMWGRPFKLVAEAYYKYLDDLIPYEVDNVRIRYLGDNIARGYAAGLDFRVNGEFVPGTESWASLSLMKTQEDIKNDFYYQYYNSDGEPIKPGITVNTIVVDSVRVEPGWIPRPTDQRFSLSIFFQDYIPGAPTWKMYLGLYYGSSVPFGPPNSPKYKHTLRIPAYKRVDIGFSKQLIGENANFSRKNPLKYFKSMWLTLEVFNLLQISNVVSYIWVSDIDNRQYAVPNYLTPRQLNLKLIAEF
ncbi:MAG: TonB-dependent receptor [Bacteroidetes bacterium]|nr:TonB-dependent receptor [Bacteroidota bacterium]